MNKIESITSKETRPALASLASSGGRRNVSANDLKKSERRLRFLEAKQRVFAKHEDLLRRLAR